MSKNASLPKTEPRDTATGASQLRSRAEFQSPSELPPNFQPRFVRLPKPGTLCQFTGLSRTQIYLLCKSGQVASHSLKRRGTCRGVRLIDFASLCRAIESFTAAEAQETTKS